MSKTCDESEDRTEADRRREIRELAFGPAPKRERVKAAETEPPQGNRVVVPLACLLVGTLIVVWSLNRCIDYSEVFQADRRARYGIVLLNTVMLITVLWITFNSVQR